MPRVGSLDRSIIEVMTALDGRRFTRRRASAAALDRIEATGDRLRALTDAALGATIQALRPRLLRDGIDGPAVEVAFAAVREITSRTLGKRHYPVQLLGGLVMIRGGLAEMQTGEGKTLTALLPAVTFALSGRPVHIVTVNDYLAQRDATALAPVYQSAGLTVGIVQSGQSVVERQAAYACDVTYCTNKELVFDYLKDRVATRAPTGAIDRTSGLLLRGLFCAIVDEADSVLIDEAQTPLIIAAERSSEERDPPYATALAIARTFAADLHYVIRNEIRGVALTDFGRRSLANLVDRFEGGWRSERACEEIVGQALHALHILEKDRHYIVTSGSVQIVDEFTGRVMPDRTWQAGLHQLIETKEGCAVTGQRITLAQITYQRFFRRYVHLAGMTGTAHEVAPEMRSVYGLKTATIATHLPCLRRHAATLVCRNAAEKWGAVAAAAAREANRGRPVLIGTRSVAASEMICERLAANGQSYVLLNARHDKAEADTIALAGTAGRITVATNMAGRGTDILLDVGVAERGGLFVILTEYHESGRIDRQLVGRTGRQGDPGSYEVIVSLDDELFSQFAPISTRVVSALPAGQFREIAAIVPRRLAQAAAARRGRRLRRRVVRQDQDLERTFYFAGAPD